MADEQMNKTDQTETNSKTSISSDLSSNKANNYIATKPAGRKKLGLAGIIIVGLAVLGAGSAAAYYGVVVPNKPENVLNKAIINTASQKKTKFDGRISYESTDEKASIKAVNVTFNGSMDMEANAYGVALEATASGAKLPVELRYVGKNAYVKIGDLSNLKDLVRSASPVYAPTFEALNAKLANQWLEIDETLLKQAKADCALSTSFALTKEDIDLLQKRYQQVPFSTVKSTSSDTVNGHSATKYDIEIDHKKSAEYFSGLQDLSVVKKIKACNSNNKTTDVNSRVDDESTPLTVWVDKGSKQIVKLAGKSTQKEEVKNKAKGSFEITMQYDQASVAKPDGAKPFLEVLGDLGQLFGLGGAATPAQAVPSGASDISQECLQAIQDYTNSGGTKPIPNCL